MAQNGTNGTQSRVTETSTAKKGNGSTEADSQILGTKKFLFVSLESLSGDLAWQLTKEGHKVKAYIKARSDQDVYNGFIEKVDRWEKWVDWSEVIIFDDVEFGHIADRLRKRGKLVIGGSKYTDKLEIDREFGQAELKKAGVNILPNFHFSNYDEAIKFIKERPDRYVFKPSGNTPSGGKGLLFLGQEEDGRDLIALLDQNKTVWQKKAPQFMLQKFVSGVEVAVGAFFNGKEFIQPINVNFEHKRIFPGDIGPFSGEMGCYDEETEVLTRAGWKFFRDVTKNDEIATLNPGGHTLEYHKPTAIVSYDHHEKMVRIKNRALDLLVTPDHNMWVGQRGKATWQFRPAKDVPASPLRLARTANWKGVSDFPVDHARFLGLYCAEGSSSKLRNGRGGYQVTIAGTNSKKIQRIQQVLKKTPWAWKRSKDGWYIYSKSLYEDLRRYGKAHEKFVPQEIKDAAPKAIEAFLEGFALGDGTIMRGGWRIFYTSSKRMADDIQELLMKIGRVGIVKQRNRYGKRIWIKDHWTEQKHDAFEVIERIKKVFAYWDKRDTSIVPYQGRVYCATVPNHIMYVRRNGKPCWCGNTLMYWSPPNCLFQATLGKMLPALQTSGYVGYIDINCIVNGRGIYPLEFTSRFGFPTIQIQLEGIQMPAGEWLYRMARGDTFELKTKKGFQIGVRVLCPTYLVSHRDTETVNTYKDLAIMFKDPDNREGVHIEDIKNDKGVWRIAGVSGCLLVVTASGTTVEEARRIVYSRLQNIVVPNMFYRTDIGASWVSDSDKLQTWGYTRQ